MKFIYGNELEQEIKNNPEGSIRIDKCDNTYIIQNDLEYGGENQELRIEEYGWEVPFVEWLKKGNIFGELGEERGCHCGGIYFNNDANSCASLLVTSDKSAPQIQLFLPIKNFIVFAVISGIPLSILSVSFKTSKASLTNLREK